MRIPPFLVATFCATLIFPVASSGVREQKQKYRRASSDECKIHLTDFLPDLESDDKTFKHHQIECELDPSAASGNANNVVPIRLTDEQMQVMFKKIISAPTSSTLVFRAGTVELGEDAVYVSPDLAPADLIDYIEEGEELLSISSRVEGDKKLLIVRVTDKNGKVVPRSAAQLGDDILGTIDDPQNLKSQFMDCSNNKLRLYADPVPGESALGVIDVTIPVSNQESDVVVRNAVTNAVQEKLGYKLPGSFDHVLYILHSNCCGGWSAYASVVGYLSVYNGPRSGNGSYTGLFMHELGHNFGLLHSGQRGFQYKDYTCAMGSAKTLYRDDGGRMCFNGAKSWQIGWYNDRMVEVNKSSTPWIGTMVGIANYANENTDRPVGIKLQVASSSTDYYIQFNHITGINSDNEEAKNQVTIVQQGGEGRYPAQSWLLAKLSEGDSHSIADFDGLSQTMTITVNRIDVDAQPAGYAHLSIICMLDPSTMCNIALGKATSQSSNYQDRTDISSSVAVDGSKESENDLGYEVGITHTKFEFGPWWEVDLGDKHSISRIVIYNRDGIFCGGKRCSFQLQGFRMEVFDGDDESAVFTYDDPTEPGQDPGAEITIDIQKCTLVGNRIRISIPGREEVLHLREVEVHGLPTTNIALGKATSQSSNYQDRTDILSSVAVDGSKNSKGLVGITHTKFEFGPWWRVNLGDHYSISRIIIYNRDEGYSFRLQGFRVEIFDGDDVNAVFTYDDPNDLGRDPGDEILIDVQICSLIGDRVKISIPGRGDVLHLREVEVYGSAASAPSASPSSRPSSSQSPSVSSEPSSIATMSLAPSSTPTGEPALDGLFVSYFQFHDNKLPPAGLINTYTPYKTEIINHIDFVTGSGYFAGSGRKDNVAASFEGTLYLDEIGEYELCLISDDGSKLFVNGVQRIDNDGLHGPQVRCWNFPNTHGRAVKMMIEFFEREGGAFLQFKWMTPKSNQMVIVPPSAWIHPSAAPTISSAPSISLPPSPKPSASFAPSISSLPSATPTGEPPLDGLFVSYFEFNGDKLPPLGLINTYTPYKTEIINHIDFVAGNGEFAGSGRHDGVAASFEGTLYLDEIGTYKLCLISDDGSKMFINEVQLIDNDGRHGAQEKCGDIVVRNKKRVKMMIEYFEAGGGATLQMKWITPKSDEKVIVPPSAWIHQPSVAPIASPAPNMSVAPSATPTDKLSSSPSSSNVSPAPSMSPVPSATPTDNPTLSPSVTPTHEPTLSPIDHGLLVSYFAFDEPKLPPSGLIDTYTPYKTETVANIDFVAGGGEFAGSGRNDRVAALFESTLHLDEIGRYKLCLRSDDGSKLFMDGALVIENDGLHGPIERCGDITVMNERAVGVVIEYFEHDGGATLQLKWITPNSDEKIIVPPSAWMRPSAAPSDAPSDKELSAAPSATPTDKPTSSPSATPTDKPTSSPSATPTDISTSSPSNIPTLLWCDESPLKVVTNRDKGKKSARTCTMIANNPKTHCENNDIKTHCPNTCGFCNEYGSSDSTGTFIFNGRLRNCKWIRSFVKPAKLPQISKLCQMDDINRTCRDTCSYFVQQKC